jgi:maltose-binding protein MalE
VLLEKSVIGGIFVKKSMIVGASIVALGTAMPVMAQSTSTVTQTGDANDAEVTQAGSGNTSDVTQSGDGAEAFVCQNGTGNEATINQSADLVTGLAPAPDAGAGALIQQNGSDNTASINQSGGLADYTFISAVNPGLFDGELGLAEAIQNGSGNNAGMTSSATRRSPA